jgi:predicted Zn-ribbon and HTH transcriptional regulator
MDKCINCGFELSAEEIENDRCDWCDEPISDDPRSQYRGDEMDLYYD